MLLATSIRMIEKIKGDGILPVSALVAALTLISSIASAGPLGSPPAITTYHQQSQQTQLVGFGFSEGGMCAAPAPACAAPGPACAAPGPTCSAPATASCAAPCTSCDSCDGGCVGECKSCGLFSCCMGTACCGSYCRETLCERLRNRMIEHKKMTCRHLHGATCYPVAAPYCKPNYGYYQTCWRRLYDDCRCPPNHYGTGMMSDSQFMNSQPVPQEAAPMLRSAPSSMPAPVPAPPAIPGEAARYRPSF